MQQPLHQVFTKLSYFCEKFLSPMIALERVVNDIVARNRRPSLVVTLTTNDRVMPTALTATG